MIKNLIIIFSAIFLFITLPSTAEADNIVLERGVQHENVITLKNNLNELGFPVTMNAPENYGPATEQAVRDLQKYYGVSVNGKADENTLAKMDEILSSPLRRGEFNSQTEELKNNLNTLGFSVTMNSPKSFGPATEQALRDFQEHYGLRVNGIGDEVTLAKINELLLPQTFKRGDNHEQIANLKNNLNTLGFPVTMNAPSNFGPATESAVRDFQNYYGLNVTGEAGADTLSKIEEILSSPLSRGQNNSQTEQLKNNLNTLGFSVTMNSPGSFGPATEQAVRDFQGHYELRVNGIGDEVTLAKIEQLLSEQPQIFRQGDNHEEVIDLKNNLNTLGFPVSMNYPDSFGPATASAVRDFQSYYGLNVTGEAGPETFNKIEEILSSPLRRGQSNSQTEVLKNNLNTLGFSVTMYTPQSYGPSTEQAVRDFQDHYGLRVSGIGDVVTLAKIEELLSLTFTQGVVTANSSLNVRSGPGTSHSAIGSLSRGATVEIRGTERNGWLSIDYNGRTGYVSGQYISLNVPSSGALRGKVIMLDPGHGDQDSGAVAGGMREKELVLDISLRAQRLLENQGATVIMTRSTDVFLTLSQRASLANNSNADVFVSVHANAFNGSANGTETFWNSRYQAANSEKLAHTLQNATVQKMGTNYRRVDQANYTVISSTRIPSALLEVGFMDHSGDAAKLRQSSYRDRSAEAIVEGLINYFR
ncbi:peptidoglycan-binding protein [Evansella sp. LMS18]|uniref:peptidoglycan-binding protein n=1 Tax=Evansella sp. LMS18 TaxID=2924033 RepID=UPI0020D112F7|nr:peptidoglycan-binding protein [Evansella sp. LMS18]UTR11815.1 peptidoglycan-binding protein [Evansella sp. LMS18]